MLQVLLFVAAFLSLGNLAASASSDATCDRYLADCAGCIAAGCGWCATNLGYCTSKEDPFCQAGLSFDHEVCTTFLGERNVRHVARQQSHSCAVYGSDCEACLSNDCGYCIDLDTGAATCNDPAFFAYCSSTTSSVSFITRNTSIDCATLLEEIKDDDSVWGLTRGELAALVVGIVIVVFIVTPATIFLVYTIIQKVKG
jgi:hypothetical protein